jgi:hypothetical protein
MRQFLAALSRRDVRVVHRRAPSQRRASRVLLQSRLSLMPPWKQTSTLPVQLTYQLRKQRRPYGPVCHPGGELKSGRQPP